MTSPTTCRGQNAISGRGSSGVSSLTPHYNPLPVATAATEKQEKRKVKTQVVWEARLMETVIYCGDADGEKKTG